MSYRTYIEDKQIFGNNEYYKDWVEFIKSKNIEVDEECHYDGYLTGNDFMEALIVLENIVMQIEESCRKNYNTSLFDYRDDYDAMVNSQNSGNKYGDSYFDKLYSMISNGYAFLPYNLLLACQPKLVGEHVLTIPNHFYCWKIKDGEKIHVRAG